MPEQVTAEVWIMVDENGEVVVRQDREELEQAYNDEIGTSGLAVRIINVKLTVPLPVPVEVVGTVPEEAKGPVTLTVGG